MNTVYLSLGSNDDPEHNLPALFARLRKQYSVLAVSPVYETLPVGDTADESPHYFNAVVCIETERDPIALRAELKAIETGLGRVKGTKSVPADVDIVLFNDAQYSPEMLNAKRPIPDPAILVDAYVAVPLADIAAKYVHPITGQTLDEIAAPLRSTAGLKLRADVRLEE